MQNIQSHCEMQGTGSPNYLIRKKSYVQPLIRQPRAGILVNRTPFFIGTTDTRNDDNAN